MSSQFSFETTAGTRRYCEWLLYCLKKYFGVSVDEGVARLNGFFAKQGLTRFEDDNLWLHEDPYTLAALVYLGPSKVKVEDGPWWSDDPRRLPPQEFRDLFYGRRGPDGRRILGGEIPWGDLKE